MPGDPLDYYGVLGLAVLFHDPPWKPWGIGVGRLRGCEGREYWACIAEKLAGSERLSRKAREAAESAIQEYTRYRGSRRDSLESHELQGALVLRVLAAELEAKGLDTAASCARAAEKLVLDKYSPLRKADRLASALDRLFLYHVEQKYKAEHGGSLPTGPGGLRLANPFNPKIRVSVPREIPAGRIVDFIARYVSMIADIIESSEWAKEDSCRALLHTAFALLEPLWYRVAGAEYIPPADTRIPTHTVFDHVNAALATMFWSGEVGGEGCIAVVDLAGVQEWISESRRLRDFWAASYIASLLAWKSVESLVEQYGPGVLVQPPARLNPFYAAWLISRLRLGGNNNIRNNLESLLNLPYGFPVDPTLPTRLTIALPGYACNNVKKLVRSGYESAWKDVMHEVRAVLEDECRKIGNHSEGIVCEALDAVEKLPPPLAQRIITVRIEQAVRAAEEIYDRATTGGIESVLSKDEFVEAAYYPVALMKLAADAESERYIAVPARFATKEYLDYARIVYAKRVRRKNGGEEEKRYKVERLLCTVCGKAAAVIDGEVLGRELAGSSSRLLGEVRDERLCPYCLAKRLFKWIMLDSRGGSGAYSPFPGLDKGRARRRLLPGSVDVYTARTQLGKENLVHAVETLAKCYARDKRSFEESIWDQKELRSPWLAPNTFLANEERRRIAGEADVSEEEVMSLEGIVLEAAHYENATKSLERLAGKLCSSEEAKEIKRELSTAWRIRRKYALLKLDGDFMGSRILKGRLGLKPEEYVRAASNIGEQESECLLAEKVGEAVKLLEDALKDYNVEGLSVPPTPSYHFSVSRALAAQALKDRKIIECSEGFLVYAGGDDVLAILPPARWRSIAVENNKVIELADPVALHAALRLRRSYWAAEEAEETVRGFHRVRFSSACSGGDIVNVVPALTVYGRSGSLLYVDSMHPLWAAIKLSTLLEESKDEAELVEAPSDVIREKDVLFVAADSGGVAILPQYTSPTWPPKVDSIANVAGLLEAAGAFSLAAGRARSGETPLPGSLVFDVRENVKRLWLIASLGGNAELVALGILERSLDENRARTLSNILYNINPGRAQGLMTPGARLEAARLLDFMARVAGLSQRSELFRLYAASGGEAGRLALSSGYAVDLNGKAAQQLFIAVMAAVKAFRSAL